MIKKMLVEAPILVKPVSSQPIIVYLATSHETIGANFVQEFPEQKANLLCLSSLTKRQN